MPPRYVLGYQAAVDYQSYRNDLEIAQAMALFIIDPPDSDYQHGFLDGLRERMRAALAALPARSGATA